MENVERYEADYKTGLTEEQVQKRIEAGLTNVNQQPKTKTVKQIILSNFFTYFNFLNLALGSAILLVGILNHQILNSLKNCLFMGVIFCNTVISIIQEIISKKTIDKLSILASTKICVVRDGQEKMIEMEEIVLDDIMKLTIGNQVVTDAIILEGEVEVNESFITGESDTIQKKKGDMILSGSFIVSGTCITRVEHIAESNYISQISKEAKYEKKTHSVIMDSFEKILKIISVIIIPIGALFFLSQYKLTGNLSESVFATVAALIGMIPEGLVLLTSSVMAVSVVRLSKYNVLVQQLYCIETLARVDVICLDKTGTITEGKMEVHDIVPEAITKEEMSGILSELCGALEDNSATFKALKDRFQPSGNHAKRKEIPFSSKRKFSAVELEGIGSIYFGSPEFLLREGEKKYHDKIEGYQKDYRLLVLARNDEELTENPNNLEVLGWILIQDKVRENAKKTLDYFKKQGVDIKIISGDNHLTVSNIARRVGLEDVRGVDASILKDEELDEAVDKYNIFGRVTPVQKKKIVQALKRKGHTVAMTGDGVNDVLALKESDCSIAMASGSDAPKNISQLVLLDSDFASMPYVVQEGRRTINNIERSSSLLLIKTTFTLLLIFICIFASSKYFFIPIQLTLITAFTIGIPSFVLALEPNNDIVKGNFLLKVIGKSLPAALTVVFNVILVMLFKYAFNLSESITSSLVVFLTGTTGFIFLYKLCQPFNVLRTCLFIFLICGFTYGATVQYSFFNMSEMNLQMAIIFSVLMICSFYIVDKLDKLVTYVLKKITKEKELDKTVEHP